MVAQAQTSNRRGRRRGGGSFKDLLHAVGYLRNHRRLALIAYSALFLATFAQLLVPQVAQNIVDAIVTGYVAGRVLELPPLAQGLVAGQMGTTLEQVQADYANAPNAVLAALLTVLALAVVKAIASFGQSFYSESLSQNLAFDFRNDLFAKIQRLSFSYHDKQQTGQLMIRATDDVERLRGFVAQGLAMTLQAIILLVGAISILLLTNFQLTLVVIPILPIALAVTTVFGALAFPLFHKVQQLLSNLNTVLQESLAGLRVVKAFAREPKVEKQFEDSALALLNQQLVVQRVFAFLFPIMFLVANLGQSAILYFAGSQIAYNTLTIGEWQKFNLYLMFVFFPMAQLGMIVSLMSQASVSAQRIFAILNAENDVTDRPGAAPLGEIKGEVVFDDVTFSYFKGGEPVLQNVSFTAEPGQTVALLGATGSGKTTVINLVPRFYDVTGGAVRINGHDVREVTIESLRSQIGIVLQETNLFTGSIRENIAFGRPDATDDEIVAAAQAAAAHEFILEFPDGYDTLVGERGSTLSGGQKQRVAIARALLMNPKILILDDSTSSVDVATEYRIQQALDTLMKGRTSFVIAQRISTVLNADQILVLDKGKIAARGTHAELIENSPIYAEIYHSQLVDDVTGDAGTEIELDVEAEGLEGQEVLS
ncbi:MAG: ABC transporter ATP-binding protein [Anaerolineae bacterium]|nr:ABC transporter ATP-binding protein [Anaerolineae bacterium]